MDPPRYRSTRQMVDALQAEGRYSFSLGELRAAVEGSEVALQASLRRLIAQRRLFRPRRGFYVIVPLEYSSVGAPPATWFIDSLMSYLRRPYYVGLLTAAAQHGASHQSPQTFQILTTSPLRPIRAANLLIAFYVWKQTPCVPTTAVNTQTGTMRISTPETTAFDLIRRPAACGHLDNVATVLAELAEGLEGRKLKEAAGFYRRPDIQRLGYVLDLVGRPELAGVLSELLPSSWKQLTPLRRDRGGPVIQRNLRWGLAVNESIEADL